MQVLVVGGAGYIGSHMIRLLVERGEQVVCFDDLSNGHADAVIGAKLEIGSLLDKPALQRLFTKYKFDAVLHFASFIAVGESIVEPAKYYQNNVSGTLNLLDAMRQFAVDQLIFSSTAAIFGTPDYVPIDEHHPQRPINPYGMSKWMIEQVLRDYAKAYGLRSVCLRYFNAAGAAPEGLLGERHEPETHLIPLILRAAKDASRSITVFGTDYPTPDGTCIRDYIHIVDLCQAHLLALDYLSSGGDSRAYNLGNGQGYSVQEVIAAVIRVTGQQPQIHYGPRRTGDPDRLIADSRQIRHDWGWQPQYADLETIVEHAWTFEKTLVTHV